MARAVAVFVASATLVLGAGCGSSGGPRSSATTPEAAVLRLGDMPRGFETGDDAGCGLVGSTEGNDPRLDALFRLDRPHACSIELRRVWAGGPGPRTVTSIAYVFSDGASATRAFKQRLGLIRFATTLSQRRATREKLGDEAWLVRGRGLNNPAAGIIWRTNRIVAALVTEPADVSATLRFARLQERRIEGRLPPATPPTQTVEIPLDDPSLTLPVYWLGRTFDPPGRLPPVTLRYAFTLHGRGSGPGNDVELEYDGAARHIVPVHIALWRPEVWRTFARTRLGRLVWDSPCARRTRVTLRQGAADVYEGYGASKPLGRPCPNGPPDIAIAHAKLPGVVVTVNIPICYTCAETGTQSRDPYNTVAGLEAVVRGLRLRRG